MVKNEVVCTPVVENEVVAIGTSVIENKGGGTQVPNNVVGNQCVDRRWWVHLCGQHRGGINQGGENLVVGTRAYSAWPGRTEYSYTITNKKQNKNIKN